MLALDACCLSHARCRSGFRSLGLILIHMQAVLRRRALWFGDVACYHSSDFLAVQGTDNVVRTSRQCLYGSRDSRDDMAIVRPSRKLGDVRASDVLHECGCGTRLLSSVRFMAAARQMRPIQMSVFM